MQKFMAAVAMIAGMTSIGAWASPGHVGDSKTARALLFPAVSKPIDASEVLYSLPDQHLSILLRQSASPDFHLTAEERQQLVDRLADIPVAHLNRLLAIDVKPYFSAPQPGIRSSLEEEDDQSKITFFVDEIANRRPPYHRTGHRPFPVDAELSTQLAHHVYERVLSASQRKVWSEIDGSYPYREGAFVDRYVLWTHRSGDVMSSFSGDAESLNEILYMAQLFADPAYQRIQWYDKSGTPSIKPCRADASALTVANNRFRLEGGTIVGVQMGGSREYSPPLPIVVPQMVLHGLGADLQVVAHS